MPTLVAAAEITRTRVGVVVDHLLGRGTTTLESQTAVQGAAGGVGPVEPALVPAAAAAVGLEEKGAVPELVSTGAAAVEVGLEESAKPEMQRAGEAAFQGTSPMLFPMFCWRGVRALGAMAESTREVPATLAAEAPVDQAAGAGAGATLLPERFQPQAPVVLAAGAVGLPRLKSAEQAVLAAAAAAAMAGTTAVRAGTAAAGAAGHLAAPAAPPSSSSTPDRRPA